MNSHRQAPLSKQDETYATEIVDAAYTIHKSLGPGLLERVYETCLCHKLRKRGLNVQRQVAIPIIYDGLQFEEAFKLDILVENTIICELKATEKMLPIHQAQLLSYMKLTQKPLGFLINFHVPLIKQGIKHSFYKYIIFVNLRVLVPSW